MPRASPERARLAYAHALMHDYLVSLRSSPEVARASADASGGTSDPREIGQWMWTLGRLYEIEIREGERRGAPRGTGSQEAPSPSPELALPWSLVRT